MIRLAAAAMFLVAIGSGPALAVRRRDGAEGLAVAWIVSSCAALGVWLSLLDLTGVRWSPLSLLAGAGVSVLAAAVLGQPAAPRWPPTPAALAASLLAVLAALASLRIAEPGWDFHYLWGLKARVFALAGGRDWEWLAWPANGWHHTDYPPLWTDAIAAVATILGPGSEPAAARLLNLALILALAAAYWWAAAGAPALLRGAAAGAFAPVLFQARHLGNAEPLVAVLAAAGFGALLRLRRYGWSPLAGAVLAGSAFALALTKREGIALAIGLAVGAAACRSVRAAVFTAGAGGCAFAGWHVALAVRGVANRPRALDPGQWLDNFVRGAAWLRASAPPELLLLLLAWPLLLPALARRPGRPVLAALAVWALAVAAAYTTTLEGAAWQLSTSLDRVAATPLAGAIAAALGSLRMPGASAAEGPPPPAA